MVHRFESSPVRASAFTFMNYLITLSILILISIILGQYFKLQKEVKELSAYKLRVDRLRGWFEYLSKGSVEYNRLKEYCKWCLNVDAGLIDISEDAIIKRVLFNKHMR
jgi:hypothetical protein